MMHGGTSTLAEYISRPGRGVPVPSQLLSCAPSRASLTRYHHVRYEDALYSYVRCKYGPLDMDSKLDRNLPSPGPLARQIHFGRHSGLLAPSVESPPPFSLGLGGGVKASNHKSGTYAYEANTNEKKEVQPDRWEKSSKQRRGKEKKLYYVRHTPWVTRAFSAGVAGLGEGCGDGGWWWWR